jgi:molecular chaperone GrpE
MTEIELAEKIIELSLIEVDKENNTSDTPEEEIIKTIKNYVKDKNLRTLAEFDNYKKRTNREINTIKENTKFDTLKEFIDILDDLSFFENVIKETKNKEIKTGFELIIKKINSFLNKMEIKEVPTNIKFNEDLHEAITLIDKNKESGDIVETVSKGYMINNRIIKYPKVIVQK